MDDTYHALLYENLMTENDTLKNRVEYLEEIIANLESAATASSSSIEKLERAISNLRENISDISSDNEALEESNDELDNRIRDQNDQIRELLKRNEQMMELLNKLQKEMPGTYRMVAESLQGADPRTSSHYVYDHKTGTIIINKRE